MTTFSVSVIGAVLVSNIDIKRKNILTLIIICAAIIPTTGYWQAREYKLFNDNHFESVFPSTTDTGESAPIWSVRFMETFPKKNLEILNGDAEIKDYKRDSTHHEYLIDVKEKSRFRENTLYFPGWKVYDNYKTLEGIEFQDPQNRGVITFYLDEGLHDIILKFEDTKLRKYANYISLISIISIILIPLIFIFFPYLKLGKYKW